jgi:hypothetical protein
MYRKIGGLGDVRQGLGFQSLAVAAPKIYGMASASHQMQGKTLFQTK